MKIEYRLTIVNVSELSSLLHILQKSFFLKYGSLIHSLFNKNMLSSCSMQGILLDAVLIIFLLHLKKGRLIFQWFFIYAYAISKYNYCITYKINPNS